VKVVILAGGLGTRISEETSSRPKPLVEIGGYPILWHIMKIYSSFGFTDFIICCGYKGHKIKEYFANYALYTSDVTFDMENNQTIVNRQHSEPWKVTLVDTGLDTMTGGRLKRVADYIEDGHDFHFTYGDGLADIDIDSLVRFHNAEKRMGTMTCVAPPGRFGALEIDNNRVVDFREKPRGDGGLINGGFFVLNKSVIDYITDDSTIWEREPLEKLAQENQLSAFTHAGFWQPMDTLRDLNYLEEKWQSGAADWKIWEELNV
jgi:glucose-1-phosphate cytidylyltransferase